MSTDTIAFAYTNPMQEAVAAFHRRNGITDAGGAPRDLPADRIAIRMQEIEQAGTLDLPLALGAGNRAEVIRAFLRVLTSAFGALVEMGREARAVPASSDSKHYTCFELDEIAPLAVVAFRSNLAALRAAALVSSSDAIASILSEIARDAFWHLTWAGIDPARYFTHVDEILAGLQ